MFSMFLDVSQLQVQYPGRVQPAVDQVTLGLRAGEMGVLIGPSGCGKTTLLRSVAGLEPVTRGRIRLNGQVVSEPGLHVPAEQRRIGMVFQDYALFPHLDVGDNIGFGLAHWKREAREQRVQAVLRLVGLASSARRLPHELSGASSSGWPWRAPSHRNPNCCCWMSLSPTWTWICVNAWPMKYARF